VTGIRALDIRFGVLPISGWCHCGAVKSGGIKRKSGERRPPLSFIHQKERGWVGLYRPLGYIILFSDCFYVGRMQ